MRNIARISFQSTLDQGLEETAQACAESLQVHAKQLIGARAKIVSDVFDSKCGESDRILFELSDLNVGLLETSGLDMDAIPSGLGSAYVLDEKRKPETAVFEGQLVPEQG